MIPQRCQIHSPITSPLPQIRAICDHTLLKVYRDLSGLRIEGFNLDNRRVDGETFPSQARPNS